MKLEKKHLAPYLPYELKVLNLVEYTLIGIMPYKTRKMFNGEDEFRLIVKSEDGEMDEFPLDESIKLILRPLSDLTEEIEHNGERFVPIEHLEIVLFREWSDSSNDFIEAMLDDVSNIDVIISKCPYDIMKVLLSWHFDVFGLIEQGLAIDINEVEG